ncbi:MAG: helix-turn-helix domain-containing protein [Omnitrophica bacterium]|nr:helix-turn-helix domain-containing protein [Candidatus Omnitrophota bacterium]
MPKKKITSSLARLVVLESRKQPYLGVRGLANRLAKRHQVIISKSAIHNILKVKGLKQAQGPKKASLLYRTRGVDNCGLILLKALDYQIGLFEHISNSLRVYFPRLSKDLLTKLITLATFSSFIGEKLEESAKNIGFLRLAGLSHLPIRKLNYFNKILARYKPVVSLKPVKENIRFVSSVKLYFNNGDCGFCDAKMSTFWDEPCRVGIFFLPLGAAIGRLKEMLKSKIIIVGYTKSFDYLSLSVFNFINGINSGLKKVQFLSESNKLLYELKVNFPKLNLFFGYCPQIAWRGAEFLVRPKKFKRFLWPELGEFFCFNALTKFSHPKAKKGVTLDNLLIKKKVLLLPDWGLLSTLTIGNKRVNIAAFLKKYLYLWPNINEEFSQDMEVIEKSLLSSSKNKDYLRKILPERLGFKESRDFARIGQILSVIFKELIWGWEPKGKRGDFSWDKDCVRILLKQIPKQAKRSFNRASLFIDGRRAFIT